MNGMWSCGDCGRRYPKAIPYCTSPFDDYLSLRGGSVESAISLAVEKAISPLVKTALKRLEPPRHTRVWASRPPTKPLHTCFVIAA